MAVEVKRKPNEKPESLINRFTRRVLQSGNLRQIKERSFRKKKKSRALKQKEKLRKLQDKQKRDYLIKIGLIKPTYRK
ncbi:hypothetical protein J7K86_01880 [bacterium]|nr:hypothetical protein [bacterium]